MIGVKIAKEKCVLDWKAMFLILYVYFGNMLHACMVIKQPMLPDYTAHMQLMRLVEERWGNVMGVVCVSVLGTKRLQTDAPYSSCQSNYMSPFKSLKLPTERSQEQEDFTCVQKCMVG